MEPNFQTSFIPKKPMIEEPMARPSRPASFFLIVAIFVFFTMILASGGLYFYKATLGNSIVEKKSSLVSAKGRFEPDKIAQLIVLDKRLQASKEILAKHITVSPIFDALSKVTIKNIRYTKFSYVLSTDGSGKVLVKMSGLASWALGYKAIALQSDIFAQNKDYNTFFIDPIFSNLVPDAKGNIIFDLDFAVNPISINYSNVIKTTVVNSPDTSLPTNADVTN